MFARAVEGKADFDGDGVLRRDELWRYVRENVRTMSEARQTPNLRPNARGREPVLRLNRSSGPVTAAPVDAVGSEADQAIQDSEAVRLTILGAGSETLASAREMLDNVRIVSYAQSPNLIWDAESRQVVTALGDVAARDVGLGALPAVIGKWEAVRTIRKLSARASLSLRVYPHDGAHPEGSRIEVEVDGLRHPRLTLIGLSGNGVVHYLYPLPSDPVELPTGQPFRLELEVTPPFGADHVVAVSAQSPLDALNAELARPGRPAGRAPGGEARGRGCRRSRTMVVRDPGPLYHSLRRRTMSMARIQSRRRSAVRSVGRKGWLVSIVAGRRDRASTCAVAEADPLARMSPQSRRLVCTGGREGVSAPPMTVARVTVARAHASTPGVSGARWARLLALFPLLALGAPAAADESSARAASEQFTRIVGGESASAGSWPWQVALVEPARARRKQGCRVPAVLRRIRDRPPVGADRGPLRR